MIYKRTVAASAPRPRTRRTGASSGRGERNARSTRSCRAAAIRTSSLGGPRRARRSASRRRIFVEMSFVERRRKTTSTRRTPREPRPTSGPCKKRPASSLRTSPSKSPRACPGAASGRSSRPGRIRDGPSVSASLRVFWRPGPRD